MKKCKVTGKTKYETEDGANKAKMWIWSHDPSADIADLHAYKCDGCGKFHVGHISYYEAQKQKERLNDVQQSR